MEPQKQEIKREEKIVNYSKIDQLVKGEKALYLK